MEEFDASGQMDDLIPMEAKTPTLYDVVNGWRISTLSWDFLYNSAVQQQINGVNTLDVYTNVRTLGAIEAGTELYIAQDNTVSYEAHTAFCLKSTLNPGTVCMVSATLIPADTPASGSLVLDVWGEEGFNSPETLAFSSWDGTTIQISGSVSGTYDPAGGTFIIYMPLSGHLDVLLLTSDDGVDIDGTTFSAYGRKFQDTFDKFVTTGGAVVSNVPIATDTDAQLDIPEATISAYSGLTLTWATGTLSYLRSAFDGGSTFEYVLAGSISASGTLIVVDSTIWPAVQTTGYLQVDNEVMYYNTFWTADAGGTFGILTRGVRDTAAIGHLAGRDISNYLFPYTIRAKSTSGHTLKQMYNWLQWLLLRPGEIDSGASGKYGKVTDELADYTGTMFTKQGVWFEGFAAADANYIQYRDDNSVLHIPPPSILLEIICIAAMEGGQASMYELSVTFDPDTYDPSDIIKVLIDGVIPGSPYTLSATIKFVSSFPVVSRARKAGRLPFEQGATVTDAGLTVRASNPEDTIYT